MSLSGGFLEDFGAGSGPNEGVAAVVPACAEDSDPLVELWRRGDAGPTQGLAFDVAEPDFYKVQL